MQLIDRMNPLNRKSTPQRIVERVQDVISNVRLPDPPSGKTVRAGLLALGGAIGAAAGSAGISSLRRRGEAPKNDS